MSLNDLTQQVRIMARDVQDLKQQMEDLTATFTSKSQVSVDMSEVVPRVVEPKVKLPEPFFGDRRDFFRFINACQLYFRLCPVSSGDNLQRVGIVMSLLQLVIRIDRRIRDRKRQESSSESVDRRTRGLETGPVPMTFTPQTEEPMQVGAISAQARSVGKWGGPKVCYYCGARGHFIAQCNKKGIAENDLFKRKNYTLYNVCEEEEVMYPARLAFFKSGGFFVLGESVCKETKKEIQIFIDSGSALNLVDTKFVVENALEIQELDTPIPVTAIDDSAFSQTHITQRICNLELKVQTNHTECLELFVMSNLPSPVVLGLPWLRKHNPMIDWKTGVISAWGVECVGRCCKSLVASVAISSIPKEIEEFTDIFSEPVVQRLPPHREYDCTVDFLPGAVMPKSRLFSLSVPERESLKEYISKSMAAGHIRPSKSPVAVGFFFR